MNMEINELFLEKLEPSWLDHILADEEEPEWPDGMTLGEYMKTLPVRFASQGGY